MRFDRRPDGVICDIYDGEAYEQHMQDGGFLSVPTNISFTINTDRAQVFHSSNVSLWPVYLVINELPVNLR